MAAAPALKPLPYLAKCLLWLAGSSSLAFVVGFCYFVMIAEQPENAPVHTDGMVVLTGGAERVETGLRLLAAGRADFLLVSGVAHSADLASLAHFAGVDAAPLATRITLGHAASSTRGNAAETAAWTRLHNVHTVIVITGFYHMPRALAELARDCPDVTFYRFPVVPPALHHWNVMGLRLLVEEYVKYILVHSGVDYVLPADLGQRPIEIMAPRA